MDKGKRYGERAKWEEWKAEVRKKTRRLLRKGFKSDERGGEINVMNYGREDIRCKRRREKLKNKLSWQNKKERKS